MSLRKEKRENKLKGSPLLVIGLGNPGRRYCNTRHNIGARVVADLAKKLRLRFRRRNRYIWSFTPENSRRLILTKTTTFMNESGKAVAEMLSEFGIKNEDCLAIVDDVNLPFGKLRLRISGSDGGHRGLASIIQELGTEEFPRLRVGIGYPQSRSIKLEDFVLQNFSREEEEKLKEFRNRAVEAILFIRECGMEKAMNYVNKS